MAKKQSNSRPARWDRAFQAAEEAWTKIEEAVAAFNEAREELDEVRAEYEEWKDNLPENLQQSPIGEKLEAISNIDTSEELTVDQPDWMGEAEGPDFPLGFGRD